MLTQLTLIQPFAEETNRTANSGIYGYSIDGAVASAGSAFHTPVPLSYYGLPEVDDEDTVRTNFLTPAAAYAGRLVERQSNDILQVAKAAHTHLKNR